MTPQADVALAPLSTIGVGGAARWYARAGSDGEVMAALEWARAHNARVWVLGGGSNIVIADEGLDGLVIHVNVTGSETREREGRVVYELGAGEPWDPVVQRSVEESCAGLECLSGIPGSVGGTPVQNVGAYGQDVSATITRVDVIDRETREALAFDNAACAFGYRTSRFKRADLDRYIVTRVEFSLEPGGAPTVTYADVVSWLRETGTTQPTLRSVRDAVLTIRRRKGMVIEPGNEANRSCGSFFVNPVVPAHDVARVGAAAGVTSVPHYQVDEHTVKIPAAWLIERAGFRKGTVRGPVGISPFQAQAIVNRGGASAADVLALACDVKRAVFDQFGVSIVPEPVFAGFTASPELRFLQTHLRS